MEAIDGLQAVHIGCGLPGRPVISGPLHEVLQLFPATEDPRVEDIVDAVLVLTVDNDRRGWQLALARERVLCRMLQERHVEDRMDLHAGRQIEAGRVRCAQVRVGEHFERTEPSVVQLAGWPSGDDVPGIEPDVVTGKKARCGQPSAIGVRGLPILCAAHLGPEVVMDAGERLGHDVGPLVVTVAVDWRREVALPGRVEAVHAEKR